MVLASENDEVVSLERARFFAESWESSFVNLGPLGHVGSAANLGLWPQGLIWLGQFVASLTAGAR
jgi:predicted alpha/beta hydrolase family esterase